MVIFHGYVSLPEGRMNPLFNTMVILDKNPLFNRLDFFKWIFTKWRDLEINLTPFHVNGFNGVIYVFFFNEYVPSGKLT